MIVCGYPKSGNTWLCYLLAYCLNTEFDDVDAPGVHPRDDYVRSLVMGGHAHSSAYPTVGRVFKTHRLSLMESSEVPVVYLVRDGRDVMVSYYYYEYSFKLTKPLYLRGDSVRQVLHGIRWKMQAVFGPPPFSKYLRRRLGSWINHLEVASEFDKALIVRYEDLRKDPFLVLARLCEAVGIGISADVIEEGIQLFSFDNLARRTAGTEDKASFYRKGITGDWRNHFQKEDIDYFWAEAGDVAARFGYAMPVSND